MNERDIVALAQKGDKNAFEQIVTIYEKKIYNMALRYTKDPEDALDICQEVFLRVYRFLPGFKGDSSLSTWIYRITMNVCHNTVGKKTNIYEMSLDSGTHDDEAQTEIADVRFDPEKEFEKMRRYHFALEDIYKETMDFSTLNRRVELWLDAIMP